MITLENYHAWSKNLITGRTECKHCESFYNTELANKIGVPDMGFCKNRIVRVGE